MAVPTTEFIARQTPIPGLLVFDVTSIGDERGWFQEKYQKAKLVQAGMPATFYRRGLLMDFRLQVKHIMFIALTIIGLRKIMINTLLLILQIRRLEWFGRFRWKNPLCRSVTVPIQCSKM
jgi:hypothetical protein